MRVDVLLVLALCTRVRSSDEDGEPDLYYYGLEESERGLSACGRREACAGVTRRAWRARALVRLCRCERRRRCDAPADEAHSLHLNDRTRLQFCQPVENWPECTATDDALVVTASHATMNPDELENAHHDNIQMTPPKLTFACRCREPNYWKLASRNDTNVSVYRCSSLRLCNTGEHCGNVSEDLYALYQTCLCPRRHICVHDGGLPRADVSELLYEGKGWKAYCRRIGDEYSYEDY